MPQLARGIRVEEFTQPGDPMRLDYGYRNGVQGYIQAVALGRDTAQAKVLAYTAERIRARVPEAEFTAITEIEPARDNSRHQFMVKLFDEQRIAVVPLNRVERFAEDLRVAIAVAVGGVGREPQVSRGLTAANGTWATGAGGSFWTKPVTRHTTLRSEPQAGSLRRPSSASAAQAPR